MLPLHAPPAADDTSSRMHLNLRSSNNHMNSNHEQQPHEQQP
jgi:hypothetical protein